MAVPKVRNFIIKLRKSIGNLISSISSTSSREDALSEEQEYDAVPKYEKNVQEENLLEKDFLEEDDDDENRDAKPRETSNLQAAWNISNLIQGTGTLGIPYAVSQGGYLALGAIVLAGWVTNYTGKLIIDCLHETSQQKDNEELIPKQRRGVKSYAHLGERCWPEYGRTIVGIMQTLQLTCACVLYLLLVADFFNDVFQKHALSYATWTVIAGLILLPSVFINKLSRISWMSMFSVFALVVVFCTVIGYGISQRQTWHWRMPLSSFTGFPVAWGIILFSFVCHPYLPGIEEDMKNPDQFHRVMNYSFLVSTLVKVGYGYIAWLTFKGQTQQEISENLPQGALQNTMNTFLCLNGLLSYALPAFTLFTIIHKARFSCIPGCYQDNETSFSCQEKLLVYGLRSLFVVVTVLVAVFVPEFSLLMALIGSVSGVALTLIFPCMFHTILNFTKLTTRVYATNMVIVCLGVLSGGFGVLFSVIALLKVNMP